MEITKAIGEFGTEAVLRYREISQEPDNEVPEIFLGGFMAPRLYERFHCPVHVERSYLLLANKEGVPISEDLVKKLGGLRADLALHQHGFPPTIIELKIVDESCSPQDVVSDVFKARRFAEVCNVRAYVGALICETRRPLPEQIQRLEVAIGRKIHTATAQRSLDGHWQWCFGGSSVF